MINKLEKFYNEFVELKYKNSDLEETKKSLEELKELFLKVFNLEIKYTKKSSFYYFIKLNLEEKILKVIERKETLINGIGKNSIDENFIDEDEELNLDYFINDNEEINLEL